MILKHVVKYYEYRMNFYVNFFPQNADIENKEILDGANV